MTRIDQPLTREAVEIAPRKRVLPQQVERLLIGQGYKCAHCDTVLSTGMPGAPPFHVDHVLPLELGGPDAFYNWQCLCVPCHKAKTRDDIKRIRKAARLRRDASPETRRRTKNPLRSRGFQRADPLKDPQ